MTVTFNEPLQQIPPPHDVRRRLSRTLRDASFLRRLLKLTEQWHRELEFRHSAETQVEAQREAGRPASDNSEVVLCK